MHVYDEAAMPSMEEMFSVSLRLEKPPSIEPRRFSGKAALR